MQIFVYFSSTCFGLICPSSGAIEFIISFTNAAYGVLGAARCLEERARWWCVALLVIDSYFKPNARYNHPKFVFEITQWG